MRTSIKIAVLCGLGVAALSLPGATVAGPAGHPAPGLPAGWHRSAARLVPLLMPRERVSLGTFSMAVGGGGNCDREPVASIRRMRPSDALVSIQEYVVTAKMRRHLTRTFTPRGKVRLDGFRRPVGEIGQDAEIHYAAVPFSFEGRAFEALIYVRGRPRRPTREAIESILRTLSPHFLGPGWTGPPV